MKKRVAFLSVFFYLFSISIMAEQKKLSININYIEKYASIAMDKMKQHGIPASITLAQGILESGAGQSELALKSNNHFGIKCHNDWTGERVYHDDDKKNECFRKYSKPELSFEDHSEFLKKQRYAKLYNLDITDYKAWANGLKECGYATDKNYANRLIDLIETYELYNYDKGIVPDYAAAKDSINNGNKSVASKYITESSMGSVPAYKIHEIITVNGRKAVIAKKNDSFDAIAKEFNLRKWQIRKYNKLKKSENIQNPEVGQTVFIARLRLIDR